MRIIDHAPQLELFLAWTPPANDAFQLTDSIISSTKEILHTGDTQMSRLSFSHVAATIFAIVALGHVVRIALALPVHIGTMSVPMWVSWAGLAVAGALSVWGFRSRS